MSTGSAKLRQSGLLGPVSHSTVRLVAYLEASSFLLLLACMVLKYAGPKIGGPVMVMGWIHGLLFLGYLFVILRARLTLGWTRKRTWTAVVSAFIPLAPYFIGHTEPSDPGSV